ncbi:MAG: sigma-54 interaction domain-containing protein [Deferrisomatales bacterium]
MDQSAVLQSIHDGLMVVDAGGRIVLANPGYERIFGVSADKVVGRMLAEIEPTSVVLDVLRTAQPVVNQPTRVVSASVDIVTTVTPVREGDVVTGAVAVFRDATDIAALKELTTRYFAELQELRSRLLATDELTSGSPRMQRVLDLVQRVALVDSTVLLTGESGVGKERIAKLIHRLSPRVEGPFAAINCGAIPETLMESELFGHEKHSFTGAGPKGKAGLIEVADGGTLLLDEVGEMPLTLQVKLLRAIQEQTFLRVGGVKPVSTNVRFLAATNRDLQSMVKQRLFREDLFYRLNVVAIRIPPLRERREDVARLTQTFLDKYNTKYRRQTRLLPDVIGFFEKSCEWPGNIRELENVIERLVVSSSEVAIGMSDDVLVEYFGLGGEKRQSVVVNDVVSLREGREILERELIHRAVGRFGSGRSAAKVLGVDHSTVARKAKQYGIDLRDL